MCSVLGTQYSVRSTAYPVFSTRLNASLAILGAVIFLCGCESNDLTPSDREPSFAEQLHAVNTGAEDTIHVTSQIVVDADLASVAGAVGLKRLVIEVADTVSAATLERLSTLPQLEMFTFRGFGIDDEGLVHMARLKTLRIINIPRGEFTDAGLANLKDLPNLVQLRFGSGSVGDEGMATLAEFPSLLRLHLIDVHITGKGLLSLAKIEKLESLYIDGGNFTDADIDALFQVRPKLHVHFNQRHHDRDPHQHAH